MKKIILIAILIIPLLGFTSVSVPFSIKGKLTDSETGEPLPFVNIVLLKAGSSYSATQSDFDGNYSLVVPQLGAYDILISTIGYQSELHSAVQFDKPGLYQSVRLNFDLKSVSIMLISPVCHAHCDCLLESIKEIPSVLKGKVIDSETGEPLPFVNIVVYNGDVQVTGGQSDFDGNYLLKSIKPGIYTVKASSVGFKPIAISNIQIGSNLAKYEDLKMESLDIILEEDFVVICCCFRSCYFYNETPPEPITDLFEEMKKQEDSTSATLPSFGFSESTFSSETMVYPNPTIGEITVAYLEGIEEISIIDINGKVIQIIPTDNQKNLSIDLSFYQQGMYFVKYFKDGKHQVKSVIKQ